MSVPSAGQWALFVIRLLRVEVHASARKHGIADEDTQHAAEHALVVYALGSERGPVRSLLLGPDRAGNLLEVVVLDLDDGRRLAIHAMRMRSAYRTLLP